MKCRHCHAPLAHKFLDLGYAPASNAYLSEDDLSRPESYFPLRVYVCAFCRLVQTEDCVSAANLFQENYAYFSSTSNTWLKHAARYSAAITRRLSLDKNAFVVEVASNDGYLLRNFVEAAIPCLGIEPTTSTAEAAERLGIPVLREFFGETLATKLAEQGRCADLIIGNNVYAHVPDINDFTRGLRILLKPGGVVTLEFPHLMRLVENGQFDTVYHEHFSYLSLIAAARIFAAAKLRIFAVEELPTHGGSLRIYGCRAEAQYREETSVFRVLEEERARGMETDVWYDSFQEQVNTIKDCFLEFLLAQKRAGKTVAGYGAAAKGNTLLNYAGVKQDLLPYICDASPAKVGKFMPGSHIPILHHAVLAERKPDFVLILPWNIASEVMAQNADLARFGTRFVTAVPRLEIV